MNLGLSMNIDLDRHKMKDKVVDACEKLPRTKQAVSTTLCLL